MDQLKGEEVQKWVAHQQGDSDKLEKGKKARKRRGEQVKGEELALWVL